MPYVRCQVVRWVADEPQPGLVEAHLVDANGRVWRFIDKEPIFCEESLRRSTRYPVPAIIHCKIVKREVGHEDGEIVIIDTRTPDGVNSTDGATVFRVPVSAISV